MADGPGVKWCGGVEVAQEANCCGVCFGRLAGDGSERGHSGGVIEDVSVPGREREIRVAVDEDFRGRLGDDGREVDGGELGFGEDGGDGIEDGAEFGEVVGCHGHEDSVRVVMTGRDSDGVEADGGEALASLVRSKIFHVEDGGEELGETVVSGLGCGGGGGVEREVRGEEVGVVVGSVDIGRSGAEGGDVQSGDVKDGTEFVILDVLEDGGAGVVGGDDVVETKENVDGEEATEVSVVSKTIEGRSDEDGVLLVEKSLLKTSEDCDEEGGDGHGLEVFIVGFEGAVDHNFLGIVGLGEVEFVVVDEEECIDEVEAVGDVGEDGDFGVVDGFEERSGAVCMPDDGHEDGAEVGEDVDLILVGGFVDGGGCLFEGGEEVGGGLVGGGVGVGDGGGTGGEDFLGGHIGCDWRGLEVTEVGQRSF